MLLGGHIGARASELLDGRLEWAEEQRLREHLGRCSTCASIVEAERDARTALRGSSDADTSPAPSQDLLAGLLAMSTGAAQRPMTAQPLGNTPPIGDAAPLGSRPMLGSGAPLRPARQQSQPRQQSHHGVRVKGTLLMTTVLVSAATMTAATSMTPQAARRVAVPPGPQLQIQQAQVAGSRTLPVVGPTATP